MKVALITGASGGIGIKTAELFVKKGYFVAAQYNTDKTSLVSLTEKLEREGFGGFLFAFKCDFADDKSVASFFEEVGKNFNHIDALVCCAGKDLIKSAECTALKDWRDLFSVNTDSAFLAVNFALKSMLSRHAGRIIFISSIWGVVGGSMESAYSASKSALIGYARALAKELGANGITVNCLCPGVIDTKMNDCFSAEEKSEIVSRTPLKRMGTAEEIAEIIYFLASDSSSFITGQILTADGGFTL